MSANELSRNYFLSLTTVANKVLNEPIFDITAYVTGVLWTVPRCSRFETYYEGTQRLAHEQQLELLEHVIAKDVRLALGSDPHKFGPECVSRHTR